MTAFELVFGLMTIVTSLALTHLLAGFVEVIRHPLGVRFLALHGLWAWSALTLTIGNWASYWGMRAITSWPALAVLLMVITWIVQYVFCALVTPEKAVDGRIDLMAFHEREHRRYVLAAIVLFVLSLVHNSALGEAGLYSEWWRDNVITLVGLALALLAFFTSRRSMEFLAAVGTAALVSYYAAITCNIAAV